jgi:hypothetical protein
MGALGGLVVVSTLALGLEAVLPMAPHKVDPTENPCPSDAVPKVVDDLNATREVVASMPMGITYKKSLEVQQELNEATTIVQLDTIMDAYLKKFNIDYHINELPRITFGFLPVLDSVSLMRSTALSPEAARESAISFLSVLSMTPKNALTAHKHPVQLFSLQDYSDRIHYTGQGWADTFDGSNSIIVINAAQPTTFPELLFSLAGKDCGFGVGSTSEDALTKATGTPTDAWLRGRVPQIDALRAYQKYVGNIAYVADWAKLNNLTLECNLGGNGQEGVYTPTVRQDGAGNAGADTWPMTTKPDGTEFPPYTWGYGYVTTGAKETDDAFQQAIENTTRYELGFGSGDSRIEGFGYPNKTLGNTVVRCQGFSIIPVF